ncbi:DUF2510 domain-containing protein [Mycolicibacterium sp.]|uniref:DUF2510 domain-containing protein n=1 Tax=Mycolicibacterium sp. TaxID=2320850 RepID=UPI00355CC570
MTDYDGHSTPAPGWHPDPGGQPGQRYHDGRRWTQHFVPTPPPAQPPPAVAVAVSTGGGANHALHAVLTLLSCGLWLPVWILVAIFSAGSGSAVAIGGPGGAVARTTNRRPLMVAAAVFGGLVVLGTAAQHPWLFVVLAILGIAGGYGFWALRSAQQREEQQRQEQFRRDMLAERADYEDQLYQEGDPRGVHGRYLPPESP